MDKKVIEFDENGIPKLSVNFAMFRMKLPEKIEKFNEEFTRIVEKIKGLIDYETGELLEEWRQHEELKRQEELR